MLADFVCNRHFDRHHRRDHGRLRRGQGPVSECLQAVAGDVEDVVAVGALLAQRLQVVLQTRERIGQRIELATIGYAVAPDQFALGIQAHAGEIVGGERELQHLQRADDFLQQTRDFRQFRVIPTGFDEGDERLAGIGEIGDGLAYDEFEHLARFAGEHGLVSTCIGAAEMRHLFVE